MKIDRRRPRFDSGRSAATSVERDVHADRVELAKALLASGRLGADPYRLADALIDHASNHND